MCSSLTFDPTLLLMTVTFYRRFLLPLRELSDDFIFLFQLFPEICHLLHHLLHLLNFAVIFAGLQTLWCYLAIIQLQKTLEFQQL